MASADLCGDHKPGNAGGTLKHIEPITAPTVSVILPTYNRQELLLESVKSVLRQTWIDYELLVVDDGSTDGTRAALAPYMARIRYIHQENAGQGAALGRGVCDARGTWVAFLHSDDKWVPERLERMMGLVARHPQVHAVATASQQISADGTPTGRLFLKTTPGLELTTADFLTRHKGLINGMGILVRRDCLQKIGGIDERLSNAIDCDLWLRLSIQFNIAFLNEPLLLYRRHEGNIGADILTNSEEWLLLLDKFAVESADYVRRNYRMYRRARASQYLRHGRELLVHNAHDPQLLCRTRADLTASLRLHPFGVRAYVYWIVSWIAPSLYARIRSWEVRRRRGRLRPANPGP